MVIIPKSRGMLLSKTNTKDFENLPKVRHKHKIILQYLAPASDMFDDNLLGLERTYR